MSEPAQAVPRFKSAAPAGAAALAVVAAVVGGTMVIRHAPSSPAAVEPVLSASPASSSPAPAAQPPVTSGAVDTGATPPDPGPAPALPGVQFDQAGASASKPALGAEIVVKFKDDNKVKDIVDTFWKDAASAKKKFDAFKASRPEFAGVKLDRVTYSNELVLAPITDVAADKRAGQVRDLASKMGKAADISYAEANVTAKPGGH